MRTAIQATTTRRRSVLVAAASALVALLAGVVSVSTISGFPPRLEARALDVSAASTRIMVDSHTSAILDPAALKGQVDAQPRRAELLGRIMASRAGVERIARRAHLSPDQIAAVARTTEGVPQTLVEPGRERRAAEIADSNRAYRLEVQARPELPILDVYAQAPTVREAERLSNAAYAGLRDYLRDLASRQAVPIEDSVSVRQVGRPHGTVVNGGARLKIFVLVFVLTFVLSCAAFAVAIRLRRSQVAQPPAEEEDPDDDWPHTTRMLPWMLAGFMAVVWLVPFNGIELAVPFPVDLKFDRLILPVIVLVWLIALAMGGRRAPRLRLTGIHVCLGAFVAVAFLSVALEASELTRSLEFDESVKRLPLLVSYVSLFVIAASVTRRTEVSAFLKYTLALALLCALGVIWEYRFNFNVFHTVSSALLPGVFTVADAGVGGVDDIGRRAVHGPAAVPLEVATMLSMALPIALTGFMQAGNTASRIKNGVAACVLMAAILATFRKTGLIAPLSVGLTLVYFRRRELLKLAPLALAGLIAVHLLSPGALGSTATQLSPDRLGVATVSDRAADYDAIAPDVWTHVALGRGWGSYSHERYRVLDTELLARLVEMGVIGLVAFVAMVLSVVVVARRTIDSRDPRWSAPALAGAAVAICFLVVSSLFDVLSFPHATYIFLYMAGMVAAVVAMPAPKHEPTERDDAWDPHTRAREGHPGRRGPHHGHAPQPVPRRALQRGHPSGGP